MAGGYIKSGKCHIRTCTYFSINAPPHQIPYSHSALGIDFLFGLESNPLVSIDSLEMRFSAVISSPHGYFIPLSCPSTSPLNPGMNSSLQSSALKMAGISVSDNLINCVLFTLHVAGKLSIPLYPSDLGSILSTNMLAFLFPSLPDLFPNHPVSLKISSKSTPPKISLQHGLLFVTFDGRIEVFLGDRQLSLLTQSLQKVIGINVQGTSNLLIYNLLSPMHNPHLVLEIAGISLFAKPEFTAIGPLNMDKVNVLLGLLDKILPSLTNDLLELNTPLTKRLPPIIDSKSLCTNLKSLKLYEP